VSEEVTTSTVCLRCEADLDFLGTKDFHEGARWGFLGDLAELFVNRERLDVYACPNCGHIEFFLDGVGDVSKKEYEALRAKKNS
jgi:DNA-directed RNA polymerase subunit RPC12/RpoP